MTYNFERENRYIVIKRKWLNYLTGTARDELFDILESLRIARQKDIDTGTNDIECVVVESDWTIYEQVWQLVEDFATGKALSQPQKTVPEVDSKFYHAMSEAVGILALVIQRTLEDYQNTEIGKALVGVQNVFDERYEYLLQKIKSQQPEVKPQEAVAWIDAKESGMFDTVFKCPKCSKKYSVQAEDTFTSMTCECGFHGYLYKELAPDQSAYIKRLEDATGAIIELDNIKSLLGDIINYSHKADFVVSNATEAINNVRTLTKKICEISLASKGEQ